MAERVVTHDEERGARLLDVFRQAFGAGMATEPAAFRRKFRKMAASPFAFYRGSACLFYADLSDETEPVDASFLDAQTRQMWIHGDLHAENFGTYMNADGRLVFDVNDFDEAYLGPYTWDLRRCVASVVLIGHDKALSDVVITRLVEDYLDGYLDAIVHMSELGHATASLTLDSAEGVVREMLDRARTRTRIGLLNDLTVVEDDRRFAVADGVRRLDDSETATVLEAFASYVDTLPQESRDRPVALRVKDVVARRGVGIGSAGLPSYNLLLEGRTQALENDVVLYMKQGQRPALLPYVSADVTAGFFHHEGHRTVLSQRALQSGLDPWLGWTSIDGVGQLVAEVSPYNLDLDWTDVTDLRAIRRLLWDLGRATATMHTAGDVGGGHSLVTFCVEDVIRAAVERDRGGFKDMMLGFAHDYAARVRRDHQLFVDLFRNEELLADEPVVELLGGEVSPGHGEHETSRPHGFLASFP